MTNTEDTNTPAQPANPIEIFEALANGTPEEVAEATAVIAGHLGVALPSTAELNPFSTGSFADTPVNLDAEWAQPDQAFRFLNWVASPKVARAWSINIEAFSVARQEGVRDLINHGLVSERRWTGGKSDGRMTLRLTELGSERLAAARLGASLIVCG